MTIMTIKASRAGIVFDQEAMREMFRQIQAAPKITVTYVRASDGELVTMEVPRASADAAVGWAVRQAQENESTATPPPLTFHDDPECQALYATRQEQSYGGTEGAVGAGQAEDLLGVYRNRESGGLEVWVDDMTRYGGTYPDTEEGMQAAVAKAAELRAG